MPGGSRAGSENGSVVREVSKTLTAERREKLLALRDRERMKGVLFEKFERKYGTDRPKNDEDTRSVSESTMRREISTFVDKATLTEDNLGRLERRMRQHARKKVINDDAVSIVSAYSKLTEAPADMPQIQPLEGISENLQYDWGRLDEYAKFLYQRDAVGQKLGIVEQKKKLKYDLDKQILDQIERKKIEKETEQRFHNMQMEDLNKWKAKEQKKEEDYRTKLRTDKETRDLQVQIENSMRDELHARKMQDEELFVRRIIDEAIVEKEKLTKKKEQDRENMKIVEAECLLDRQQKKKISDQQREQDIEFAREYGEMEDKKERAKQAVLQGRLDRQKARADQMELLVAGVQRKQEADAAEKSAKEREEIDRKKMEAEKTKAEKLKGMRLETQEFLLKQMRERDALKQERQEDKIMTSKILSNDSAEYDKIRKEEEEEKRLRNLRHRGELDKQIQTKREIRADAMSQQEILYNRDLLNKVDDVLPPPPKSIPSSPK